MTLVLSFSQERISEDLFLAQRKFFSGYINLENRNYEEAIRDFTSSFNLDRTGYYGELSYLYLGYSYALLSYSKGDRKGLFSSIAFLNMYPFYFKKPTYADLQAEFLAEVHLLLEDYSKAKEIYMSLYRKTGQKKYLGKFLYSEALEGSTKNTELLLSIQPGDEGIEDYLVPLIRGYYLYNLGNFKEAVFELNQARALNRYLENDPHFLYRLALSYYMIQDWRNSLFYFELLERKDLSFRYRESSNYFLLFINLENKNYSEAKEKLENLMKDDFLRSLNLRLALSQLWLYGDFIEKYKLTWYKPTLIKIAWIDYNKYYGLPSILGVYYYSLKNGEIVDRELMRRVRIEKEGHITIEDIKINLGPLYTVLEDTYNKLNPYDKKDFELVESLYKVNVENFLILFSPEVLVRGALFNGKKDYNELLGRVSEPTKSFLTAQLLILEDKDKEGIELLNKMKDQLSGEDKIEALFIIGLLSENKNLLEQALQYQGLENSIRLRDYKPLALLELGDHYYLIQNFSKAKDYYKSYLESAEESSLYWLTALRLARLSSLTKDQETLRWVVKRAEQTDNIIGKVIISLWGD
ncbi:tetratricopeptide repeat protein [Thermocrinis sp.]